MAFSDKLREAMRNKEMRAADLSRETGLSEAIISEYLSGKKEPRGRQSVSISKALDVSLDVLWETEFAGSDIKKAPAEQPEPAGRNIPLEASNRLLIELGFIRDGEDLADADLAVLAHVIGILDAWFRRKRT